MRTVLRLRQRSTPWWELIISLWLLTLAIPPALALESLNTTQASILLSLFLIATAFKRLDFLYAPIYRQQPSILFTATGLIGTLAVGALLSEAPLLSLGYVVMTAVVLVLSGGLWELTEGRMLSALRFYACSGSLIVGYVCLNREEFSSWFSGRLSFTAVSHPNYLGLISFGFAISSLAINNRTIRIIVVLINLCAIVFSQSRSALAASMAGIITNECLLLVSNSRRHTWRLGFKAAVMVALVISLPWTADWLLEATNALFLLDDRYRGLGTGFTGRIGAWREVLDLFGENPFFGVGFRMHERYMATLSSAHNGYLSMLADTGLSGTVLALTLMLLLLRRTVTLGVRASRVGRIATSFCIGYCVIALFERFFLNSGNPTSILMWTLLMVPAQIPSRAQLAKLHSSRQTFETTNAEASPLH